jgi:hypothetical protein
MRELLDRLVSFMPGRTPPPKVTVDVTSPEDRQKMLNDLREQQRRLSALDAQVDVVLPPSRLKERR